MGCGCNKKKKTGTSKVTERRPAKPIKNLPIVNKLGIKKTTLVKK